MEHTVKKGLEPIEPEPEELISLNPLLNQESSLVNIFSLLKRTKKFWDTG